MMGCVEELNCLILQHLPENGMIRVQLMVSDSLVMRDVYKRQENNSNILTIKKALGR